MGFEDLLVGELEALGAGDIVAGRRVVSFTGDKALMYRANFALRTATRVLVPIRVFVAHSAEDVYKEVYSIPWEEYISAGQTFAVDSVTYSEAFTNSHFVAYRVKDAIVDYFRAKTGSRPNISVSNPDIQLHIHISDSEATLALDSSGESLHRRGYRIETGEAPINEVLAAGILLRTGWQGETDLIDPMCGSGTFLIEAALIARNIAPGIFRQGYAFERWADYDRELWQTIYDDDSHERAFTHHIYGYDIDPKAVAMSNRNIKQAGLGAYITVAQRDIADFCEPAEKALLVTNPPYGERISTPNLLATYKTLGERLKHAFKGNEAWVISYKDECFHQIGLKPSLRIAMNNGSLPCELHKYQLFDGSYKAFRHDGGVIKPAAETLIEAKKPDVRSVVRATKTKSYYQRRQEQKANEDADIRSFTFLSLARQREKEAKTLRRGRRDDDAAPSGKGRPERRGDKRASTPRGHSKGGDGAPRAMSPSPRGYGKGGDASQRAMSPSPRRSSKGGDASQGAMSPSPRGRGKGGDGATRAMSPSPRRSGKGGDGATRAATARGHRDSSRRAHPRVDRQANTKKRKQIFHDNE